MKNLKSLMVLFLALICISSSNTTMAQQAQGHVFVMTNYERAFPDNGTNRELDSLTVSLNNIIFGKENEYVVSHKTVRHFWGHDSRDFVEIIELKSFDDVDKAFEKTNELFKKAFPTKEARDAFNKAYNKYFTGKHSDEIYSEVVFNK